MNLDVTCLSHGLVSEAPKNFTEAHFVSILVSGSYSLPPKARNIHSSVFKVRKIRNAN
jgi:hypothetical protein